MGIDDSAFLEPILEAENCFAKLRADREALKNLAELARRLTGVFLSGGKVIAAGNGGSMADAMHFAEEWTGRFKQDRKPYPAMAISDPTHLTCVGNDYGFERVFSRAIEALAKPEDMVILLSTSGNSENLILASDSAHKKGTYVVGLLGRGGGRLASKCDLVVLAPGETSDRIQEVHMMCLHALIDLVEKELEATS